MNRTRRLCIATLLAALTLPVTAGLASQTDRTLKQSIDIDAPIAEVWAMFSTAEGLMKWMAPLVELDLRVGGTIKSNYQPDGVIGDEHTIVNTILAYEPQRMLSLKATNPPADFAYADAIKDTWSVMYFQAIEGDRTRVDINGLGYRDDPDSEAMFEFFKRGNEWVLGQLKDAAEAGIKRDGVQEDAELNEILAEASDKSMKTKDSTPQIIETLGRMVGGVWIHERNTSDGTVIRIHNEIKPGPDGKSLLMLGWQDRGEGMSLHATTLAYRLTEGQGRGVAIISVDQHGGISRGTITLDDDDATLTWDWPIRQLNDTTEHYRFSTQFKGENSYEMIMHLLDAEGAVSMSAPAISFSRRENDHAGR